MESWVSPKEKEELVIQSKGRTLSHLLVVNLTVATDILGSIVLISIVSIEGLVKRPWTVSLMWVLVVSLLRSLLAKCLQCWKLVNISLKNQWCIKSLWWSQLWLLLYEIDRDEHAGAPWLFTFGILPCCCDFVQLSWDLQKLPCEKEPRQAKKKHTLYFCSGPKTAN